MSTDARETVFENVRKALEPLAGRETCPDYDLEITIAGPRIEGGGTWEVFERNLKAVNGRMFREVPGVAGFLRQGGYLKGYCAPELEELLGPALKEASLRYETSFNRDDYESYQFGITRATAAIAESGSIILDDERTSDRLAALAPWVHIAVLNTRELIPTIAEAATSLGSSPNVIWCTGPSKTADVEGILIEGVHGPGEQIALVLPNA